MQNKKELRLSRFLRGRTYVFIDAANVFYSQQTLKWKVDYGKLKNYLEESLVVKKIYFYSGKVGANDKQVKFLYRLKRLGYIIRSKEVKKIQVGPNLFERKGNLDVELTMDLMKSINDFDSCILMSGTAISRPLLMR